MAKYQNFLSKISSNRDRTALRGIFSMFLTDNDPPQLKDLTLASIVLSGTETTQITISGASTTGILQSGTSTTAYSITGAFTTGISIAADGTTAIAVTNAFSGVDMISLAGTGSTSGILISGACAIPLNVTGAFTTGITLAADGTTGISITNAFTGVTGISIAGTASGDGILISGACADGIHISGTNTASGLHISGDQADSILIDVDAATARGIAITVDDGITCTVGIELGRSGTTGICTTGIMIDTDGTTALWIGTGFTGTTGVLIAGTASADGISITGVCADGIHVSGAMTSAGIHVSGDQVAGFLFDSTAAAQAAYRAAIPTGITLDSGLDINCTSTGVVTTGITLQGTGTITTGLLLSATTVTTGISITSATTTGISISGTATNAISIAGACTTAINIARATAKTAIRVGEWAASQAAGSAVVFATNMAGVDTSQLNIIAAFGESTSDLTSAYSTSVIRGRHLVSAAADTAFTHEVYGVMGQVVCKNASFNHYASGVMGTFEASNTLTHVMSGYVAAAVTGRLGGGVLTSESGAIVAGVAAINNSSAHTATGIIAGFATHKTATGIAWPTGLYMPSGSVTMGIDITCSAIGASGRIAKLIGSSAAGNFGDGYGAVECELTLTGTIAGQCTGLSSWVNIGASAVVGGNTVCAQDNGIYVPTAGAPMASAIGIMGMRMHYVAEGGENPGALHLFSTNIYSNVLTSLFRVNAIVDMGGSTGAQTSNDYKIPLFYDQTAGQLWYVNIYHS